MYEVKLAECDLVDPVNYDIMKRYVVFLLKGIKLPYPNLHSCKEHRARASHHEQSISQCSVSSNRFPLRQLCSILDVPMDSGPMGMSRPKPAGEN